MGLALSDVTRTIASGLTTLARSKFAADAARLLELAQEHRHRRLRDRAAHQPRRLGGPARPGHARLHAQPGQAHAAAHPAWDERLTTAAAERSLLEADVSRRRRAEVIDKVAATLILQSALDRLKLFQRG